MLFFAICFVILASMTWAVTTKPLSSADETAHLDYAYELWQGHLPSFFRGLEFRPAFAPGPPVQWVSQHPPLYYALIAPVVGPLIAGNHAYRAALAGCFMNALLAGALVYAVWFAVRRVWRSQPRLAAVAAIITSLTALVISVGGAVFNDFPVTILGCFALGLTATVIRSGLTTRLTVALTVVGTLGMLSRLSFAVYLVAIAGAIVVAPGAGGTRFAGWRSAGWRRKIVTLVVVGAAVLIFSAWFYVRNYMQTGNIAGSHTAWGVEHLGRFHHDKIGVAKAPYFWQGLFAMFRYTRLDLSVTTWWLLLAPMFLALVRGLVGGVRTRFRAVTSSSVWFVLLGIGVTAITIYLQVLFVAQGGAANTRYSLPLIPLIALLMALGLTWGRWFGLALVVVWAAFAVHKYVSWAALGATFWPIHALVRLGYLTFGLSLIALLGMLIAFVFATIRPTIVSTEPAPGPPAAPETASVPETDSGTRAADPAATAPAPAVAGLGGPEE